MIGLSQLIVCNGMINMASCNQSHSKSICTPNSSTKTRKRIRLWYTKGIWGVGVEMVADTHRGRIFFLLKTELEGGCFLELPGGMGVGAFFLAT